MLKFQNSKLSFSSLHFTILITTLQENNDEICCMTILEENECAEAGWEEDKSRKHAIL